MAPSSASKPPATLGRQRSSASFLPSLPVARSASQGSTKATPPTPASGATTQGAGASSFQPPPPSASSSATAPFSTTLDDSPPSTGETTSSFQTSSSDESSPYDSASEGPVPPAIANGRRELELDRAEEAQGFELGSDAEDEAWGGGGGIGGGGGVGGLDDDATSPFIATHAHSGGRRPRRNSRSYDRRRHKSTTPSSGNLTLFQLTANMLALTVSPAVLALPYATYLLSPPLFIPLLCAVAGLAAANHLGIVYVARYLGVKRFEDLGRGFGGGRKTRVAMRVSMVLAGVGVMVLYLRMITDLLLPIGLASGAEPSFWRSHVLCTLAVGLLITPLLYPSYLHSKTITRLSLLSALLPIIVFIVGLVKTVALSKGEFEGTRPAPWERQRFGFVLGGSGEGRGPVWGGMSVITFIFSAHVYTLPNYSTLLKPSQRSFALSPVLQSAILLALALPLSLVPYFLLPPASPPPPMLLDAFPNTDRWVGVARVCAAGMAASGLPMVFLPTRNVVARLVKPWGVEGGGLEGVGRRGKEFYAVTAALWAACVGLALVGGRAGEFVPLVGVFGAFALGFLLPALLFIVLFHLRRPLSIIFPPSASQQPPPTPVPGSTDPATSAFPNPFSQTAAQLSSDSLLAKKERQLQRRRTSKRIWQDLVFFLAGVPLSVLVTAWTAGRMVGVW